MLKNAYKPSDRIPLQKNVHQLIATLEKRCEKTRNNSIHSHGTECTPENKLQKMTRTFREIDEKQMKKQNEKEIVQKKSRP